MTDWIQHNGGECPVAAGTMVEVAMRDGGFEIHKAAAFDWDKLGGDWDILAYRLHTPSQSVTDGDKVTVDRAAFEKWWPTIVPATPDGVLEGFCVALRSAAWEAWQARAALAHSEESVDSVTVPRSEWLAMKRDAERYRFASDSIGWNVCQYNKVHGWLPASDFEIDAAKSISCKDTTGEDV